MDTRYFITKLEEDFAAANVAQSRRVAEELLAFVLGCKPLEVYLHSAPLSPTEIQHLNALSKRIRSGEPIQYVVGFTEFFGLKMHCDSRALIPRPETELLVEEILQAPLWNTTAPRITEVGTGSGCITIALASQRPQGVYTAIDCSKEALDLAQENARLHGVAKAIQWKQGSLLDGVEEKSLEGVIANLPYIPTSDWKKLDPEVLNYEPRLALDGGDDGLDLIRKLIQQARETLVPGGMLFLEFGFDQGAAVKTLLEKNGFESIQIKQDLAGHDRMGIAICPHT